MGLHTLDILPIYPSSDRSCAFNSIHFESYLEVIMEASHKHSASLLHVKTHGSFSGFRVNIKIRHSSFNENKSLKKQQPNFKATFKVAAEVKLL